MTINEVAPPGFGHTKGDKEKGVKKGGTAAAFDKARKEGRFKGSKSDMFAIMWSQKKKGDKPHYKPGTDKKYKKYQTEAVKGQDTESRKEGAKERATEKRAHAAWKPGTKKRPLYSTTRHTKGDAESYATQQKQSIKWHDKRTKGKFIPGTTSESLGFTIDSGEHKKASKKAKIRNLAKGNTNPNEKAAAEKKAGGPKLYGEENSMKEMTYQEAIDAGWEMTGEGIWWPPQSETVSEKISFPMFKKKAEQRKPEKAQDAGAKARRAMKRREHAKYVSGSEDNVPDDIRD